MASIEALVGTLSSFLWGQFLWLAILGVGGFLTVRLLALPLRKLPYAWRVLWQGRRSRARGTIAPFSALMLSLSATIGTGNIAGVATAIGLGGPGALFWMWLSAVLGMATKYGEAVCAVHFREVNSTGEYVGGPMYYIKNGLPKIFLPLAFAFAVFAAVAGFGIGNAVQANSIADALATGFGLSRLWVVPLLILPVGLVLLGGVQSIAKTAKALVPTMAALYLAAGLLVIVLNIQALPEVLVLVVESAFTGTAAQGGFAGAALALAIEKGIARGVFSNEAGLGSAPIAHAAARTNSPVKQGCIAMLGTFIDTLVVCTITGFAILLTGAWTSGEQGAALSQMAFNMALPLGDKLVAVCLCLFAFTTILGWSYYGERCVEFLFGHRARYPYRVVWVLVIPLGILGSLDFVWSISDLFNGLMALPNLVALVLLSGTIARLSREFFSRESNKEEEPS